MNILPKLSNYFFGSSENISIDCSVIDRLLDDIMIKIFKNLPSRKLGHVRLVSKKWKTLIQNQPFKLSTLLISLNFKETLENLLKQLTPSKPGISYNTGIINPPSVYEGKFLDNLILIKGISKEDLNKADFIIRAIWQQKTTEGKYSPITYQVVREIEIKAISPYLTLEKSLFIGKLTSFIFMKVEEANQKRSEKVFNLCRTLL